MAGRGNRTQTKAEALRDWARENHPSYDVAYLLSLKANEADGRASVGQLPNAPTVQGLGSDDAAAYSAGLSALGLS